MVADAGGTVVVDADGTMVANEDAIPIAAVDYRQPMLFVSEGLAPWSSHSDPLDVHRASPCLMAPMTTVVNNLAVHWIMERMGYSAGHGLGLHHQGDANLIQVQLCHRYLGLGTDRANASYIIPEPIICPMIQPRPMTRVQAL
jgi:hypothetical protein